MQRCGNAGIRKYPKPSHVMIKTASKTSLVSLHQQGRLCWHGPYDWDEVRLRCICF